MADVSSIEGFRDWQQRFAEPRGSTDPQEPSESSDPTTEALCQDVRDQVQGSQPFPSRPERPLSQSSTLTVVTAPKHQTQEGAIMSGLAGQT